MELIKQLREKTGAGISDCKKALDEAGVVGFLGLLVVIGAFFWIWHKSKDIKHISLGERATLLGIMIAYLVQGIVLFDIFPSYLALFSLLAYMAYTYS
jgi:hypothetical protein